MLRVLLAQGKLVLQQVTYIPCMALLPRNFIQSEVSIHTACSKRVTSFFNSFCSNVEKQVALFVTPFTVAQDTCAKTYYAEGRITPKEGYGTCAKTLVWKWRNPFFCCCCLFEQNFVRASSNLLDMTNQQEWFNIQKVWEIRKESKEKGLFRYKGASKAKVLKTLKNHASRFCLKKIGDL